MNRTKLKNYAPQARKDFIQAVTTKAAQYGLTAAKIEPMTEKGDFVLIAGKPFAKALGDKRKRLEERIKKYGFEQTMEAMAYTWFNRLVAVRYMELHGYLEHGFRVLSHPEGHAQPEILEKAQYVDLPGLDQKKVVELKLDGTKEEVLYRLLLTAQLNALSKAMPFLFEKIDDETELLLPDSLLNSDSLVRKLVTDIDEEDWKEVEIIGWLYQFYISDKKDEVIGKVVKSEDIPAATQLFTPNWIVKYLVQNTIGRRWLATYPQSSLRSKMEYYIEPAEQTPEVQEQLKAITPTSLNPEELTLLDPACGSGHILVEAYDLFKTIYEERGYRAKDIPALILQKNLFGLEIDDRAAQLAAFALMMKARADYPRIFGSEAQPNVVSFVESKGLDAEDIHFALMSPLPSEKQVVEPPRPDGFLFETENNLFTQVAEAKAAQIVANRSLPHISIEDIASLIGLFENAKTFGSLIQIQPTLAQKLPEIEQRLSDVLKNGDLTHNAARVLAPLLRQARFLARQYDAVVANPPYMGGKYFDKVLTVFAKATQEDGRADLYACFMLRNMNLARPAGHVAMITMQNWMFLSSFQELRETICTRLSIENFVHIGRGMWGSDFGTCSFVFRMNRTQRYIGTYRRLFDKERSVATVDELEDRFLTTPSYLVAAADFGLIPGSPFSYWTTPTVRSVFANSPSLANLSPPRTGMTTGDDGRFLRLWHEVSSSTFTPDMKSAKEANESEKRWFPYNKGGSYCKWYGNNLSVVNWKNDGAEIKEWVVTNPNDPNTTSWSRRIFNHEHFFSECVTWTLLSGTNFCVRYIPQGSVFNVNGPSLFGLGQNVRYITALMNSKVGLYILRAINPTLAFNPGDVSKLPVIITEDAAMFAAIDSMASELIETHKAEWDAKEVSWGFKSLPLTEISKNTSFVSVSWDAFQQLSASVKAKCQGLEERLNQQFATLYGLSDEVTPEVEDIDPSLMTPDCSESVKRLISYALGCIMGRYSLDKPGLIYAQSGNEGFDPSQYKTIRADDDGIIPLLESDWGIRDDAVNRIFQLISAVWPKEHLDENLKFIADSLSPTNGEQPKDTIRRYLANGFYRHHLSTYKKRPIYWLFSSGKQRAFQCLVYLHRYNEGTLARMRTEYVIPLMGKMTARLEHLQGAPDQKGTGGEIAATSAVTVKRKLEKERDNIKKQLAELQAFDEKLRHYADLRIKFDLDDGVKANYGKFSDPQYGDILAEVKAICGTKDED